MRKNERMYIAKLDTFSTRYIAVSPTQYEAKMTVLEAYNEDFKRTHDGKDIHNTIDVATNRSLWEIATEEQLDILIIYPNQARKIMR